MVNKERIMTFLNLIQGSARTIPQLDQKETNEMSQNISESVDYIKELINEKPVMPKIFDDWAENFSLDTKDGLEEALWVLFDIYYNGNTDSELENWMRFDRTDEEKYSKCVDAVVNGYEVEK